MTNTTSSTNSASTTKIGKQRVTLFFKPSIVKHARAQAIIEDLTLTKIVEKALINYLPKEIILKKIETD